MQVYLVNPGDMSFGVGVITPRWLYVLAGATPGSFGDPIIIDETIETFSATADLADRSGMTFAQFVPLTPFPRTGMRISKSPERAADLAVSGKTPY